MPKKNRRKFSRAEAGRLLRDLAGGLSLIAVVWLGWYFVMVIRDNLELERKDVVFGATFSKKYASEIGLDWKRAYIDTLDDLGVRLLRIPAYWDEIEPEPGAYKFSDVDWQLDEAEKRGAKVLLVVGRKLPRWPECHVPQWAEGMTEPLAQTRVLAMLEAAVRHFQDHPAVVAWQVENEPLFTYGLCPPPSRPFLQREVAVVRALDTRPVVITESGELSTWITAASIANVLGISTYRIVWSPYVGYFYWPISPAVYQRRASTVRPLVDRVILTELQAEPWFSGPTHFGSPIEDQIKLMDPARLAAHVSFARRIGFPEVYLWGIEWWYWLKQQGRPEMWEAGKNLWVEQRP